MWLARSFYLRLPRISARPSNTTTRGRPSRNAGNVSSGKGVTRDSAVRFEAKMLARAYAICAHRHLIKNFPVESTEFVIKVSNPLGKYVLVDRVCKNCPLMT
ncbi:Gag-Pol polyprotein [Gossypium australe]|uniref:Gag-Pol polyprotein n=1 Tax=Gossypium australe TaxID=47621 RepID=A0A5B6VNR4_9ROSI|nr:Gag-Pol polyprotein [Gossypium australe]